MDLSAHINVEKATGANDLALVPFDGGTKASNMDQDSMVLVIHELAPNVDDEGLGQLVFQNLAGDEVIFQKF